MATSVLARRVLSSCARRARPLGPGRPLVMAAATVLAAGCVGLFPLPAPSADLSAIRLPPGFAIEVFAHDLGRPRLMTLDPRGTLLVSVPRAGRVLALPDDDGDGKADRTIPVVEGLDLPHGLAFRGNDLYVAETGQVVRLAYDPLSRRATTPARIVVPGLPARGAHFTRTIVVGPDGHLYVSVGSSCNACEERDPRRAAITRYEADGSGEARVATGLRNAVGLAFRPGTAELWATNNGRDWLGDDEPPEQVTRVDRGAFYGWPHCVWMRAGLRPDPDHGRPDRCQAVARPTLTYQAHTAPLGLAFYTGGQFPPEYRGDLFVALHGSWNRSVPAGYKVIRVRLDGPAPRAEDFATGWLTGARPWGRPVDVLVAPDGSLLVSDDQGGRVFRIAYRPR